MPRSPSASSVEFGALLRTARDKAGLSTPDLAMKLNLARESVDRYMRGDRRPQRATVVRWEQLCRCEPGSLVDAFDALPPLRQPGAKPGDTAPAPDPELVAPSPEPDDVWLGTQRGAGPVRRGRGVLVACGVAVAIAAVGYFAGNPAGLTGSDAGATKPDPVFARRLSAINTRLDHVRLRERHKLSAAGPKGQATAAMHLRDAFAAAARELGRLPASSRETAATADMRSSFASARDAYGAMATAATAGHVAAFAAAARRVKRAERDTDTALSSLRALGYEPELA